jgi:DNA-binding response OmpR family regulator
LAKILLIEDDTDLALTIVDYLSREQHIIEHVDEGLTGKEALRQGGYDLVILDWDLPGMSGIELLRFYRGQGGKAGVLMLTAHGTLQNKETGFGSGADDYLTKPFELPELAMRVRALLRRPPAMSSDSITVRDIVLDPVKHRVTKAGVEIKLMPKDFALLEFLMRHPDEIFHADSLLSRVWPADAAIAPESLRVGIMRIRKALGEDDTTHSIIENVARIGYRLKT